MRRARYLLLSSLLVAAGMARADDDFIVYSPYVTAGQSEVEFRAHQQFDADPALGNERAYVVSLAHSFTDWWRPEIYVGSYEREPGGANRLQGYEFENTFQLTDQGEYWADLGFLASYEYNTQPDQPGVLEFGPLLEKRSGHVDQRLNLIWEKQLGGGADRHYEFRGSYAASYQFDPKFALGGEAYYRPDDSARQAGPAISGEFATSKGNEFEYSVAYLFGLNKGAPNRTLALRLEYEFN
ncbi:MAG TPA: hypothetical protein VLV87_05685 [Gammaproteobacteria bacterium]|nr:hypothetical protein [Gammaproteobacteria bacterium]